MHQLFVSDHPNLEAELKYNFYYTYFKEYFDYILPQIDIPQVEVCNKCEILVKKMRDPALCQNAKRKAATELLVHKEWPRNFTTN